MKNRFLLVSLLSAAALIAPASAQTVSIPASPNWSRALPYAPDTTVKITDEYAKHIGRDAYFWAWPMINIYNRRLSFAPVKESTRMGPLILAPLNQITMLTDYLDPAERAVACPNQDVIYGIGGIALDLSPTVVQVPDFGHRFWVYQIVDARTDSFVQLGSMYGTKPGFYLLVGPNWHGEVPKGITKVFRSATNSGIVGPRIFQDDTAEDKQAVQEPLKGVVVYPLSDYDGKMKTKDWANIPRLPPPPASDEETRWVFPDKFADQLPIVLADAPPLPGEEARYAQVLAVLQAIKADPKLKAAFTAGAEEADRLLVTPLFQFRNYGQQLPHHWSTISNESAFGTDYFTRTAVAKSNILVNAPNETKYFYQDLDEDGARLNNANRYTVTFPKDGTPPSYGFWSLSIYNEHHFFIANPINRFSVGTKNRDLKYNPDGSLTIYVQTDEPTDPVQRANWLPAPKGDFSLYVRSYWPKPAVLDGSWTPPPVKKTN